MRHHPPVQSQPADGRSRGATPVPHRPGCLVVASPFRSFHLSSHPRRPRPRAAWEHSPDDAEAFRGSEADGERTGRPGGRPPGSKPAAYKRPGRDPPGAGTGPFRWRRRRRVLLSAGRGDGAKRRAIARQIQVPDWPGCPSPSRRDLFPTVRDARHFRSRASRPRRRAAGRPAAAKARTRRHG